MQRYGCLYADPPWKYDDPLGKRGAGSHYSQLTMSELHDLDVNALAADDCALFLWVTNPLLRDCINVGRSWGFEHYGKAFCWAKTNRVTQTTFFKGLGRWARGNTEDCLLFLKGNPKRAKEATSVDQLIIAPLPPPNKFSAKPDIARARTAELVGDVPKMELFARQEYVGWDVLGEEVDGRDIREVLGFKSDKYSL